MNGRPYAPVRGGLGPPSVSVARADGGSTHEIRERNTEHVSDEQQMIQERRICALLNPVDGFAVEAGELAESLLAELGSVAGSSDVGPDLAAAGEDPGGQRIGWHPYTLAGPMIIVCTIVGTDECGQRRGRNDFPIKTPVRMT